MSRTSVVRRLLIVAGACLVLSGSAPGGNQHTACLLDCAEPGDNQVDHDDLDALMSQWGLFGTPCDVDGDGVNIVDFLALLQQFGPCPKPANDDCSGATLLNRTEPQGTTVEHFEMSSATASPDRYKCPPDPAVHADTWYCLTNATGSPTFISITTTLNLHVEVNAGCTCPPGPLVACGPGLLGLAPFLLQPGDQVLIRLINLLDLPQGKLSGDLQIENAPGKGCCVPGACLTLPSLTCLQLGGNPVPACLGDNEGDGTDDACQPVKGCCLPDGCFTVPHQTCVQFGGFPVPACLGDNEGDGIDDACEPVKGCCFPDACLTVPVQTCLQFGGFPVPACLGDDEGDGTDDACQPVKGCCFPDACLTVPHLTCLQFGGNPVPACLGDTDGSGVDDACEPVKGCCFPDACLTLPSQTCLQFGGNPVPACLGDTDGNDVDDACEPTPADS